MMLEQFLRNMNILRLLLARCFARASKARQHPSSRKQQPADTASLTSHCCTVRAPRIIVSCLLCFDLYVSEVQCILFCFVPPGFHIPKGRICSRLHAEDCSSPQRTPAFDAHRPAELPGQRLLHWRSAILSKKVSQTYKTLGSVASLRMGRLHVARDSYRHTIFLGLLKCS